MYQVILVPLDMSRRAERILPHVEDLAHRYDAKVIFLYVLEPKLGIVGPDGYQVDVSEEVVKKRKKEAEMYLTSWQGEFREKGISARTRLENGPVVATIINVAEREKADSTAVSRLGFCSEWTVLCYSSDRDRRNLTVEIMTRRLCFRFN